MEVPAHSARPLDEANDHAAPAIREKTLRRVLEVARLLGSSDDLSQVLSTIIDAMRDVLDAERATVFEFDGPRDELFTTVAHGVTDGAARASAEEGAAQPLPTKNSGPQTLDAREGDGLLSGAPAQTVIRIPASVGIAGECAQTRQVINVPDAYADPRFNQAVDRTTGFRTRSILTVPLEGVDGELIGVAQVLNKRGGPFTRDDEDIACALAGQAAVAIKRARLMHDRLVRDKLEREIEVARRLQQQTFPERLPVLRGYELGGRSDPADQTGGDAYDAVALCAAGDAWRVAGDDEAGDGALLLMADATGHGVGPALSVTQARAMLRMGVRLGADLWRIAAQMNEQLCDDLVSGRFITAWIAVLDVRTHTLASLSAGQAPLLHFRASTNELEQHDADTLPLGIARDLGVRGSAARLTLEPGDMFVVLSDGFFEARGRGGEQFGIGRVGDVLREHREKAPQAVIDEIVAAVASFSGGAPAEDDQTAVIIKRL